MLTFFSACLAISGKLEEEWRSGLTFCTVEESKRYSCCLCLKVGKYQINTESKAEKKIKATKREDTVVKLIGKLLRSGTFRLTVLFVYIAYIAVSIYGILNVVVYFDKTKLIWRSRTTSTPTSATPGYTTSGPSARPRPSSRTSQRNLGGRRLTLSFALCSLRGFRHLLQDDLCRDQPRCPS